MSSPASNLADVTHLRPVPDPKPPVQTEGEPTIPELERWATLLRAECVRMLAVAKSGHLDSSLSAADIVAALYYKVLRHDPERPDWPERDRFVLCKGHAAPIQYAALAHHGYFPLEVSAAALHSSGRVIVVHTDSGRLGHVQPAPTPRPPMAAYVAGVGTQIGLLSSPTAVAVTNPGVVLVLDAGAAQLAAFDLNGSP